MRTIELITPELDAGATIEQSIEPLTRRASDLRAIGLRVTGRVAARGAAIGQAIGRSKADIIVVCPHFSEDVTILRQSLGDAHHRAGGPALVLLDVFDQSSSPLLPLLDVVDRYAKKSILKDRSRYLTPMAGGYIFTDWLVRERGVDLNGWHFGSVAPSERALSKLQLAWNFSAASRYRRLCWTGRWLGSAWHRRRFDVNARFAGVSDDGRDWYANTRQSLRAELRRSCADLRLTPDGRISLRQYIWEQRQCRVTVSPFGYGELCLRDIEAIAAGSLLIKPDMSHLEVSPDLFIAGETYLPIRWDGSDVGDVIRGALTDPARSMQIVRNARARFEDYSRRRGWVEDARRVFEGL